MNAIKTIAVTGKGGTGKTIIATLLLKALAGCFPKVLAIDADSAMSLPYTLGLSVQSTVSDLRKDVVGAGQWKKELDGKPLRSIMSRLLVHGRGFDLLVMGRPEEPGCFCAVNELLRYGIDSLIDGYDVAVIDGEAGPEQLNRRVLKNIDILLVLADMSARSLETAAGIIRVAQGRDGDIRVGKAGLVLNRVRNDQPEQALIEKIGLDILGCVPEDSTVNEYDRAGRSLWELPDDSPVPEAVRRILAKVLPDGGPFVRNHHPSEPG
ncbi:MAG: AAA family ATPase [Desulfovibrio sp.]|jgi:CO dehydrogenase maturation factor|nr:AAA family ATPase [Desulfovibrio sp.]